MINNIVGAKVTHCLFCLFLKLNYELPLPYCEVMVINLSVNRSVNGCGYHGNTYYPSGGDGTHSRQGKTKLFLIVRGMRLCVVPGLVVKFKQYILRMLGAKYPKFNPKFLSHLKT